MKHASRSPSDVSTLIERRRPVGTEPPPSVDQHLLAILAGPPGVYETPGELFARRELELGNTFAGLPKHQACALHVRLTVRFPGDVVAMRFATLAMDRRARLLTFLRLHCGE